jgi:hypothetical protein
MRRLHLAHVIRTTFLLMATCGLNGCEHAGSDSTRLARSFVAGDINAEAGTIGNQRLDELQEVEIRIRGLVKLSPKGSAILYLSRDQATIESSAFGNCINLILDKKLKFDLPVLSEYQLTGEIVLIERLDPTIVYLTYKGIRFDTDCQAFKQSKQYPYFFVRKVAKLETG